LAKLTWSNSRDRVLHECERKYYFSYVSKARSNSKDERLRRIAFFKKLKSIPLWRGEIFHSLIENHLNLLKTRQMNISDSKICDDFRQNAEVQWAYSKNRSFIDEPKEIGKEGKLALLEHFYEMDVPKDTFDNVIETVLRNYDCFREWSQSIGLEKLFNNTRNIWIEPNVFGPNAPGFEMEGVQIVVKVDFAFITNGGEFVIYDWKTGKPPLYPNQSIEASHLQANIYQLWPHYKNDFPLDKIVAHVVYFGSFPFEIRSYKLDNNMKVYIEMIARKSIKRMKQFHQSYSGNNLEVDDFDFCTSPIKCIQCQFKTLCQEEILNG